MPEVLVHKAVEPDNLTREGKERMLRLVDPLVGFTRATLVQPKFDGVYAQFLFVDGGWRAYSRTGEFLPSVSQAVYRTFDAKALTDRRYMGELWLPQTQHSVINGLARKHSEQHLEVRLFDSVHLQHPHIRFGGETYEERLDYLFEGTFVEPVREIPLPEVVPEPMEYLYDLARGIRNRSSAYDGIILRDRFGLFIPGAGKTGEVIKIKPRASGDFRVVGTTRGVGNRAGGIGAVVVDLGGGITCEVGTGLKREDVFGEDPTGRIAEVEYLSLTREGKLREPALKAWRFDKKVADVIHHDRGD